MAGSAVSASMATNAWANLMTLQIPKSGVLGGFGFPVDLGLLAGGLAAAGFAGDAPGAGEVGSTDGGAVAASHVDPATRSHRLYIRHIGPK